MFRPTTRRGAAITVAALAALSLTACSAGSFGSSGDEAGKTTITWLTGGDEQATASANALVDAFMAANPDITVKLDARPAGGDADNLVKTRLQTGSMADVFDYNSGSLFQQIAPEQNLQPLSTDVELKDVESTFLPTVSVGDQAYGAPYGTAFAGGVMYNKKVYADLGLSIPTTWDEFISNSETIKDAGIAPVIQTYQDTWTSQVLVLSDFHNVSAVEPDWAEQYTANEIKYATDPVALAGFEHLQEIHDKGLQNADYASATLEDGLRMLADGTGAQYPILSSLVSNLNTIAPESVDDIGFFAIPGDEASTNGLTAFYPNGVYIPKTTTGDKLEASKKFVAFVGSPEGCDALSTSSTPTGPYLIKGCSLGDVPPAIQDVQTYFDDDEQSPALEYLSPVKGPSLEQITVEVGSGITSATEGAALYDQDVKKQAQQLGLEGW